MKVDYSYIWKELHILFFSLENRQVLPISSVSSVALCSVWQFNDFRCSIAFLIYLPVQPLQFKTIVFIETACASLKSSKVGNLMQEAITVPLNDSLNNIYITTLLKRETKVMFCNISFNSKFCCEHITKISVFILWVLQWKIVCFSLPCTPAQHGSFRKK